MRQILNVDRAFAVIFAVNVERSAVFYEHFGFSDSFNYRRKASSAISD